MHEKNYSLGDNYQYNMMEMALSYALLGWKVFPLHNPTPEGGCSCGNACHNIGKHPRTKNGHKDATTNEATLKQWWSEWPGASIGIVVGKETGLLVFDVDTRKNGEKTYAALEAQHGQMPATVKSLTGGGGWHSIYAYPDAEIIGGNDKLGLGIDVKAKGYIVAPPSLHESGKCYEWACDPWSHELNQAPDWALDMLKVGQRALTATSAAIPAVGGLTAKQALKQAVGIVSSTPEGNRNNTLNEEAFKLGKYVVSNQLTYEQVEGELVEAGETAGLSYPEAKKTFASGLEAGMREAKQQGVDVPIEAEKPSPADLADAIVNLYIKPSGRALHYYRGDWWTWTGTRYKAHPLNTMQFLIARHLQLGSEKVRAMAKKGSVGDVHLNMAAKCYIPDDVEMPVWLGADLTPRESRNTVALSNGIMDIEAYLVGNGVTIMDHSPAYFSSVSLPYAFEADAECPRWEAFLEEVLPDEDSRNLIQEFFGYCLILDTSYQKALIMVGEGRNGKSTALKVLGQLIGPENYTSIPLERFQGNFSLAGSVGKLANIVNEMSGNDKTAEEILKNYISGEPMTFEQKYKAPFTAIPTARLVFSTNILPRFMDRSGGIWRRLFIVNFPVVISEDKIDHQLDDKLRAELPGIFLWALEGLKRLRERGEFIEPEYSKREKVELRKAANPAVEFFEDFCSATVDAETPKQQLYTAYKQYCVERGYSPLNESNFGREVYRYFKGAAESQRRVNGQRIRFYRGVEFHNGLAIR